MKEHINNLNKVLDEEKWSADVATEWSPMEGFFDQSANKIASGLKSASDDLQMAMARLSFYINRAGKNLSLEDKARLREARKKLSVTYEDTEALSEGRKGDFDEGDVQDLERLLDVMDGVSNSIGDLLSFRRLPYLLGQSNLKRLRKIDDIMSNIVSEVSDDFVNTRYLAKKVV